MPTLAQDDVKSAQQFHDVRINSTPTGATQVDGHTTAKANHFNKVAIKAPKQGGAPGRLLKAMRKNSKILAKQAEPPSQMDFQ